MIAIATTSKPDPDAQSDYYQPGDDLLMELMRRSPLPNNRIFLTVAIAHRLSGYTRFDVRRELAPGREGAP